MVICGEQRCDLRDPVTAYTRVVTDNIFESFVLFHVHLLQFTLILVSSLCLSKNLTPRRNMFTVALGKEGRICD